MTEGKNAYEWMKRLGAHDAGAGAATTKSGCEALTIGTHRSHRVACLASTPTRLEKFQHRAHLAPEARATPTETVPAPGTSTMDLKSHPAVAASLDVTTST